MTKRIDNSIRFFSLFVILIAFVAIVGCGQDKTPSSQQQAPASTAPVATTPAPAPAPVAAPPAAAPQSVAPSTTPSPATTSPGVATTAAPAPGVQNSAQVQVGMTSQQVLQLMGNPGRTKQEGAMLEWEYYTPQGKFEVYFQNDKVARISTH